MVEERDLSLSYQEYGDEKKDLMVFLHGGGVSGWMWDQQIAYFSSRYHCIVPDLPEHGKSDSGETFSINASSEMISRLIKEKREDKQVIVIGFSLGAQVLLAMLSQHPTLINYAIVNSALVKPIPFSNTLIKSLYFSYPLVKLRAFSKVQAKSMYIDSSYYDIYYQDSCKISSASFVRIMQENMSFRLPNAFKDCQSKILVTVGEKERGVMKASLNEIVSLNPNCTGIVLPKVGHGVSLAKPDYFNRLVEQWIEKETLPTDVKQVV